MGSIPPITKNLLIINVLCFFASIAFASHGIDFDELFGLHFFLASHFRPWQLFTYMFMHAGWQHLFFNMFAVWMFGRIMEQTMGQGRFLFYYLTCGLGAGLMQELVQVMQYWYLGYGSFEQVSLGGTLVPMADYLNRWNTVGASGAVYGILLAFGMTYPEERMFIFPLPVPIKASTSSWATPSSSSFQPSRSRATEWHTWLTWAVCSSACCSSSTGAAGTAKAADAAATEATATATARGTDCDAGSPP